MNTLTLVASRSISTKDMPGFIGTGDFSERYVLPAKYSRIL
jgi:hypothetical protein